MKTSLLCLISFLTACGSGKHHDPQPQKIAVVEELLGISAKSDCQRAEEVFGEKSLYRWTLAKPEELQILSLDTKLKTVNYVENGLVHEREGSADFNYENRQLFFKTSSRALKLSFPPASYGRIKDGPNGTEYIVSLLTFDDGSGVRAFFLCPKNP